MKFNMETMGANIRRLRRAKDWTQEELADRLDVSAASIINYENGKGSPSYQVAWKMCDLFGVTLDALGSRQTAA
jgi:transcriptional regulator with XRE-family HTH domain